MHLVFHNEFLKIKRSIHSIQSLTYLIFILGTYVLNIIIWLIS